VWPGWIQTAFAETAAATTLKRTLVRGPALGTGASGRQYYRLAEGPGEPHLVRMDLIRSGGHALRRFTKGRRKSLLNFVHLAEARIVDAQSPARVEFLDRYEGAGSSGGSFGSTYRPQEIASAHVLEALVRQVRGVAVSPVSGRPIGFAVCTGNHVDNGQLNELQWFIDTMNGGTAVVPNSGGPTAEGVMTDTWGDSRYWHPGAADDDYKQLYGFPSYPRLLAKATSPFRSTGIGMPWFQTIGNRDGLVQGNIPRNPFFDSVARGRVKVRALPSQIDPSQGFTPATMYVRSLLGGDQTGSPAAFTDAPVREVTADARRKIFTRKEFVEQMLSSAGAPAGHGFTEANLPKADGSIACYWHSDAYEHFRLIGLDTVNPGGHNSGSVGDKQLKWLEQRLIEASSHYYDSSGRPVSTRNKDRYVVLFSHHGLGSLDNTEGGESDPLQAGLTDLPRHRAGEVEALVHRFPNVIAWVNGHEGANGVHPKPEPGGRSGFWDIATGPAGDWAGQARLLDVVDNSNGTLSIYCTMVDHAGSAVPRGADGVLKIASIARELAANDIHGGYDAGGRGRHEDRNVELVIRAPFRVSTASSAPGATDVPAHSASA
jgi:metallophosphoesterase (TIGR03767 family)